MIMNTNRYIGMGIFQEAKHRSTDGMGYRARRFRIIWQSKKVSWQHILLDWGIRWSDKWQLFPIWNTSNNSSRGLMFGIWKIYFEISYFRAKNSNYLFKMPFYRRFRKFYLLFF